MQIINILSQYNFHHALLIFLLIRIFLYFFSLRYLTPRLKYPKKLTNYFSFNTSAQHIEYDHKKIHNMEFVGILFLNLLQFSVLYFQLGPMVN